MNSAEATGGHFRRRLRGRFLSYILGTGLLALGGSAALFAFYAVLVAEPPGGFLVAAALALPLGWLLRGVGTPDAEPSRREAIGGVLLTWLVLPAVSAAPFLVTGGLSPIDAMFESMSGFTTTGATILTDFGRFTSSLMMWRAFSQWVGGVGIVVLFIAVFPQLAIAGRQLFFAEQPGPTEERLAPRLRSTAAVVVTLYAGLTLAAIVAYLLAGMSPYDAVAHSFTTLAAGGFSPNPLSLSAYGAGAQWVAIVFMFLAGASFTLLYRAISGRPRELLRSAEFRAYAGIVVVSGVLLAVLISPEYGPAAALRHGLFQSMSITTTTGYASVDFTSWSTPAQALLVVLLFIGGSAGSAAGGVKVVRWLIIIKNTAREVRRALHPRAVLPVRVGRRIIPDEVMRSVAAFITLYIGLFAVGTVALVFLGADFATAFSASITCLGNTGPGLEQLGPMGNFAGLHPLSRVLLTFLMYAGRLEVVTVFVLFDASFWRLPRRRVRSSWP